MHLVAELFKISNLTQQPTTDKEEFLPEISIVFWVMDYLWEHSEELITLSFDGREANAAD